MFFLTRMNLTLDYRWFPSLESLDDNKNVESLVKLCGRQQNWSLSVFAWLNTVHILKYDVSECERFENHWHKSLNQDTWHGHHGHDHFYVLILILITLDLQR